ncbi:unnamed protein product, partial [Didymodactylos carnosus]
ARVIIASRNVERGQIAVDTLREKTGSKQIEFMQCDLCSLDSVRKFCKTFNENESRLDCLINNADGYNSIIQANYLGHFLLTNLLLDKLKQCKPSRIVNVSSGLHYSVKHIDWNDIFSQFKDRSLFGPYSSSKAFQIMFTKKLKDDLGKAGVNSFATNPGWVWTSIQNPMREAIGLLGFLIFYPLLYAAKIFFAQNSKTGAQTTIYCAVASELINSNEVYFASRVKRKAKWNFKESKSAPNCSKPFQEVIKRIFPRQLYELDMGRLHSSIASQPTTSTPQPLSRNQSKMRTSSNLPTLQTSSQRRIQGQDRTSSSVKHPPASSNVDESSITVRRLSSNLKGRLPDDTVNILNDWFDSHVDHPYPTKDEKLELAEQCGVSLQKVSTWFNNRRTRTRNTRPKQIQDDLLRQIEHLKSVVVLQQQTPYSPLF